MLRRDQVPAHDLITFQWVAPGQRDAPLLRQALAAPHSVVRGRSVRDPLFPRRSEGDRSQMFIPVAAAESLKMRALCRMTVALLMAVTLASAGCAARAHSIAQLKSDPRFSDRRVIVEGVVTTAWGVPLVPFRFYKIGDGTGELTVLSRHSRTPTRGARVRVSGHVSDLAVLGGQPLGLHIEEEDLHVLRN
jgi:hypothetical protein